MLVQYILRTNRFNLATWMIIVISRKRLWLQSETRAEGRRKKEEERRKKKEGRRKKEEEGKRRREEEGRRKNNAEGRGKKGEGRRRQD